MREQTLRRLKELMSDPPEALGTAMERMEACEDISQWEVLHLDFALAMGREMLERRLAEAEPPPGPCPHCGAREEGPPPPGAKPAGVSPPRRRSRRGGAGRGRR